MTAATSLDLLLSLLLVLNLAYLAPATSGVGYLIALTGIPVYLIWRRRSQHRTVSD